MAFNWQTFRTRTLTAAIFVVVMLAGLLINHWTFFILFSIIHFGCWFEYQKLVGLIDKGYQQITPLHKYGMMLAGWCIMFYFSGEAYTIFGLRWHEPGWWAGPMLIFILLLIESSFTKQIQLKNIGYSALGLLYISLSWGLMMDLRSAGVSISCMNGGGIAGVETNYNYFIFPFVIIPLTIIISLWINDTMAYIIGSLIGKTPLSKISPKKTWEGTLGGLLFSVIATGLIFSNLDPEIMIRRFHYDFSNYVWYIVAAISAIAGTFGDLLESKLKRMANVKDSGTLMPGHGGFLDRFDSMLLAIPFVWLYVYFFIR